MPLKACIMHRLWLDLHAISCSLMVLLNETHIWDSNIRPRFLTTVWKGMVSPDGQKWSVVDYGLTNLLSPFLKKNRVNIIDCVSKEILWVILSNRIALPLIIICLLFNFIFIFSDSMGKILIYHFNNLRIEHKDYFYLR